MCRTPFLSNLPRSRRYVVAPDKVAELLLRAWSTAHIGLSSATMVLLVARDNTTLVPQPRTATGKADRPPVRCRATRLRRASFRRILLSNGPCMRHRSKEERLGTSDQHIRSRLTGVQALARPRHSQMLHEKRFALRGHVALPPVRTTAIDGHWHQRKCPMANTTLVRLRTP